MAKKNPEGALIPWFCNKKEKIKEILNIYCEENYQRFIKNTNIDIIRKKGKGNKYYLSNKIYNLYKYINK